MPNPLVKYKEFHKNETNIIIHQVCVPLLLMSIYAILPIYISFCINIFYSITYLLFDVFSNKSIHSIYYLQYIFLMHYVCRFLSFEINVAIHIFSWILQIIGHKIIENNTPAFFDNLYDSFLFAPYFTFIETYYNSSFEPHEKYTIVKDDYNPAKKTIVYFAGLFQKAEKEYKSISDRLSNYNHIYINTWFNDNDTYKDVLLKIIEELNHIDIECIIGFSQGGSLSLQLKKIYTEKYSKEIKCVLISPAGFNSNTFFENTIKYISAYLYYLYGNDKWYMIKNYPTYQNENKLDENDYIIISEHDYIHPPKPIHHHQNRIIYKYASHSSMLQIVKKQDIIGQLIKYNYQIDKVSTKKLTSYTNKLLFGGHFYPYSVTLWISISLYNLYYFIKNEYSYANLLYGFLLASTVWTFTEYIFHRFILHYLLYAHHKKHHIYPNKLSIINTPLSVVILNWFLYVFIFKLFVEHKIILSYYVFFPLNYVTFEIIHLLSHYYKGSNRIIRNAKYYHKLHHIDENINYNFVTPFWDYLFGTLSEKYKISNIELLFGYIPFYSFAVSSNNDSNK